MFSLILKDLFVLKKSILISGIFIAAMLLVFQNISGDGAFAGTAIFTAAMVAVTYMLNGNACAYAEKSKEDVIFNSMPVSRVTVVASRYLSVYVFFCIGMAFYLLITALINLAHLPIKVYPLTLEGLIGGLFAVNLMHSINLPALFKLGYVKSRMVSFILFFAFFFGGNFLAEYIYQNRNAALIRSLLEFVNSQTETALGIGYLLLLLAILALSLLISVRIYRKKEF